mgnify:CR=1 FL=1
MRDLREAASREDLVEGHAHAQRAELDDTLGLVDIGGLREEMMRVPMLKKLCANLASQKLSSPMT